MATPDRFLPDIARDVAALRARLDYVDQRSQAARPIYLAESATSAQNEALSTTPTVKASVSVNTPVGYTSVLVLADASAQAVNSRAVLDFLRVQPNIGGTDGWSPYRSVPAGGSDSVVEHQNRIITGLTAGTPVVVQVKSWTDGGAWAINAANSWAIRAVFMFTR